MYNHFNGERKEDAPYLMDKKTYESLGQRVAHLLPSQRNVVLLMSLYDLAVVNPAHPVDDPHAPTDVMFLGIRFLHVDVFQPIGGILVYSYIDQSRVLSACIREYIHDLYELGLYVLTSVSPPLKFFKNIVHHLVGLDKDLDSEPGAIIFSACPIKIITHLYDTQSLILKLQLLFKVRHVKFKCKYGTHRQNIAKFKDVYAVMNSSPDFKILKDFFDTGREIPKGLHYFTLGFFGLFSKMNNEGLLSRDSQSCANFINAIREYYHFFEFRNMTSEKVVFNWSDVVYNLRTMRFIKPEKEEEVPFSQTLSSVNQEKLYVSPQKPITSQEKPSCSQQNTSPKQEQLFIGQNLHLFQQEISCKDLINSSTKLISSDESVGGTADLEKKLKRKPLLGHNLNLFEQEVPCNDSVDSSTDSASSEERVKSASGLDKNEKTKPLIGQHLYMFEQEIPSKLPIDSSTDLTSSGESVGGAVGLDKIVKNKPLVAQNLRLFQQEVPSKSSTDSSIDLTSSGESFKDAARLDNKVKKIYQNQNLHMFEQEVISSKRSTDSSKDLTSSGESVGGAAELDKKLKKHPLIGQNLLHMFEQEIIPSKDSSDSTDLTSSGESVGGAAGLYKTEKKNSLIGQHLYMFEREIIPSEDPSDSTDLTSGGESVVGASKLDKKENKKSLIGQNLYMFEQEIIPSKDTTDASADLVSSGESVEETIGLDKKEKKKLKKKAKKAKDKTKLQSIPESLKDSQNSGSSSREEELQAMREITEKLRQSRIKGIPTGLLDGCNLPKTETRNPQRQDPLDFDNEENSVTKELISNIKTIIYLFPIIHCRQLLRVKPESFFTEPLDFFVTQIQTKANEIPYVYYFGHVHHMLDEELAFRTMENTKGLYLASKD